MKEVVVRLDDAPIMQGMGSLCWMQDFALKHADTADPVDQATMRIIMAHLNRPKGESDAD